MRKLVMDEECRILFCNIDLQELRMRALYDVECPVWQLAHLRDQSSIQMLLSLIDWNQMSVLLDHDERTDWTQGASSWLP